MPRIARTDIIARTVITFSGRFGETPAHYVFERDDENDPFLTCQVEDPIAIARLLDIDCYILAPARAGETAVAASHGVPSQIEAPSSPAAAPEAPAVSLVSEARAFYREATGKNPSPRWALGTIFEKLIDHGRALGAEAALAAAQEETAPATDQPEGDGDGEGEGEDQDEGEDEDGEDPEPTNPAYSLDAPPIEG